MKLLKPKLAAGLAAMLLGASAAIAADDAALGAADELRDRLSAMPANAQCDWFVQRMSGQQLARATDTQLLAILQSLESSALFCPIKRMVAQTPEYEFLMLRRERVRESDALPDTPERMFVRLRHAPLTIYARWEKDGARAGQEVLYDAGKDGRKMLAHVGGMFGVVSMNVPIDGAIARAQSRHTVRDLGMGFIVAQLEADLERSQASNLPTRPASVKVVRDGISRYAELVYEHPGMPPYYAKRTRFWLDLREPMIRMVESRDNQGEVFEHIVFESLQRKPLAPNAFDAKNPEYRF
ncbi:DUF1571 domain-containing protein [Noviherbaspirillum autotrophicum]|uniref:DUF1571 domain-containing protein n=1 Tax=Noviherbaspirillum autotrophicum TaxID=709839 RepID=UPI000693E795|nr:DUF1571 domain-containing protein [Noviherbaspirillum autotrophicum]